MHRKKTKKFNIYAVDRVSDSSFLERFRVGVRVATRVVRVESENLAVDSFQGFFRYVKLILRRHEINEYYRNL